MKQGSELYKKHIENCNIEHMHFIWDETPWIVEANTGQYVQIMEWCRDKFGQEGWYCSHGNFIGPTWVGFATKEMMEEFLLFLSAIKEEK